MVGLMYSKSLSRYHERCTMDVSGNIPNASKKGAPNGVAKEGTDQDYVVDNGAVYTKRK